MSVTGSSCQTVPDVMTYADFQQLEQPASPQAIAYGDDPLQHVNLWLPESNGPHPVVVLIHGGCWQSSIAKADIMNRMADAFVRRGIAVWNVEYRGVDVAGGGYPGTFQDVAAAADLLESKAGELGLDASRAVAVGHSAGGHLALWLAGRSRIGEESPLYGSGTLPLRAVVSIGGLPDLEKARVEASGACGAETIDRLIGADREKPFSDTSPVELLPLGRKQIMISGDADVIAPPTFAESYANKAKASGDETRIITVPAQGHFELITPGTKAGDMVIDMAIEHLGTPHEP